MGKIENKQPHAVGTLIRDVIVMLKCDMYMYAASNRNQDFLEVFFIFSQYKIGVSNGEQEKETIICVIMGKKNISLAISVITRQVNR